MPVRPAEAADLEDIVGMKHALWPDADTEELRVESIDTINGRPPSTLPVAILVAIDGDQRVGFLEVGLRSHADGCDPRRACGFIEGWYVLPGRRGHGVGRLLMEGAEAWSREQGCTEIASDTWIDSDGSQHAHAALDFEVVDRCVHFRKALATPR